MTVPCGVATLVCKPVEKSISIDHPMADLTWIEGMVLLGLRKGAHGAGMWSLPGGRLEPRERPEDAARREVLEETGISLEWVEPFKPAPYNNTMAGGQPWVTLFFLSWVEGVEAKLMEPEKCEKWEWFHLSRPPRPLFEPFAAMLKQAEEWKLREFRRIQEGTQERLEEGVGGG